MEMTCIDFLPAGRRGATGVLASLRFFNRGKNVLRLKPFTGYGGSHEMPAFKALDCCSVQD